MGLPNPSLPHTQGDHTPALQQICGYIAHLSSLCKQNLFQSAFWWARVNRIQQDFLSPTARVFPLSCKVISSPLLCQMDLVWDSSLSSPPVCLGTIQKAFMPQEQVYLWSSTHFVVFHLHLTVSPMAWKREGLTWHFALLCMDRAKLS